MEIEPNFDRLSDLKTNTKERSGLWWVIVVAIGVLVGNALSFGAQELYTRWQIKEFMVTVDAMLDKQYERSLEQKKLQMEQNVAQRKAIKRERSINSQLQKTCMFWREQVRKENTSQNRAYRDTACARVGGLFR